MPRCLHYHSVCKFSPGDIALVIGGNGYILKRVKILKYLREPLGTQRVHHCYKVEYLDGPAQGTLRNFDPQDIILEKDYRQELLTGSLG